MTPHQEDKQSNLKMGKGPEETLLSGGHTEGPEIYKKDAQHHQPSERCKLKPQ